jgi:hypothetical protein
MDYSFIYRFIVIICSHSWGSGGLWPWQKACKDLQTKVGISALVFGFTTLKGLELNMAPSTFEIIGDEHWWFLKNLYLVLMWIDNIYQKNKKWNLMKTDETWWNLMKSDENQDFLRFHQISSVFISFHQVAIFQFQSQSFWYEIWWNLMKPDENQDFIRFHQFSSFFISFHQVAIFQFQSQSFWFQKDSEIFTKWTCSTPTLINLIAMWFKSFHQVDLHDLLPNTTFGLVYHYMVWFVWLKKLESNPEGSPLVTFHE